MNFTFFFIRLPEYGALSLKFVGVYVFLDYL